MVEPGDGMGLTGHPGGVGARDLLDRDLALEALVEGAVHRAHAARADPLDAPKAPHDQLAHHSNLRRSPSRAHNLRRDPITSCKQGSYSPR